MFFHTFLCIFIFILWEWVYYCGIYLASLTYLSHSKDPKMRQVTHEELLAFNLFLYAFWRMLCSTYKPTALKAFLDVKCHVFESNAEVKFSFFVTKPWQRRSHMVWEAVQWAWDFFGLGLSAEEQPWTEYCSKAGSVLWFFQAENAHKLGSPSSCLNVQQWSQWLLQQGLSPELWFLLHVFVSWSYFYLFYHLPLMNAFPLRAPSYIHIYSYLKNVKGWWYLAWRGRQKCQSLVPKLSMWGLIISRTNVWVKWATFWRFVSVC